MNKYDHTVRDHLDNLTHLVLKTNLENPISLVDDECTQVLVDEALCVLRYLSAQASGYRTKSEN
jgi:hypothetical protein